MGREKRGELVYMIYRALTYGLTPLINLHLRWRKFQGLEHPIRWRERLGRPSLPRPLGPLLWFHAVSLGEGMAAIPVINRCVERRPDVNVLMTTTTISAFDVIKNLLPNDVIYQFAPLDTPSAMDAFLGYWKPSAIVLMENELWPNLVIGASRKGIILALLNGRMSLKSFNNWSAPVVFPLASFMLSKFSLIVPLSTMQAIRFQLLQAPPFVINFSGDLKYGMHIYIEYLNFLEKLLYAEKTDSPQSTDSEMTIICKDNFASPNLMVQNNIFTTVFRSSRIEELVNAKRDANDMEDLLIQLTHRHVWMASSIHSGEEKVIIEVHKVLKQMFPDIVTIIVPRHPQLGQEIAHDLQQEGEGVALRSRNDALMPKTSIYVVDTLGELRHFYRLAPIAVIGGSFLPGLTGHNISEAAAAGCAVLTGHHVGHFSHMTVAMQQLNPSSVLQVGGKVELEEAVCELLSNARALDERRMAAKQAFHALSSGVIENAWNLLYFNIYSKQLKEPMAC